MRCYICNVELSENEVQIEEHSKKEDGAVVLKAEPCSTCTDIIMDTAYSEGFEPGDGSKSHDHSSLLEKNDEE